MKLGDIQEGKSIIVPSENGVEVFMKALPTLEEGLSKDNKAYSKIQFSFATENNEFFEPGLMNPYDFDMARFTRGAKTYQEDKKSKDEDVKYYRLVIGNFARLKHIFGTFMTTENYKILEDVDVDTLKDFMEVVEKLYAEDLFETKFTVMVGYDKQGYVKFPSIGDCISSKYKPKTLTYDPKSNLTLRKVAATPDSEGGSTPTRTSNYNTNEV